MICIDEYLQFIFFSCIYFIIHIQDGERGKKLKNLTLSPWKLWNTISNSCQCILGEIFLVCPKGHYSITGSSNDCEGICNCKEKQCNFLNGTCPDGCKKGWMGPQCQYRGDSYCPIYVLCPTVMCSCRSHMHLYSFVAIVNRLPNRQRRMSAQMHRKPIFWLVQMQWWIHYISIRSNYVWR